MSGLNRPFGLAVAQLGPLSLADSRAAAVKRLIALLLLVLKVAVNPVQAWVKPRPTLRCPCCGQAMQIVRRRMRPATLGREPEETLAGVAML